MAGLRSYWRQGLVVVQAGTELEQRGEKAGRLVSAVTGASRGSWGTEYRAD